MLLVGLRTDALRVAHSLSGRFGPAAVCVGGTITLKSALTVSDRRSAAHARADGVQNGCSVFVAYGVEPGTDVAAAVRDIGADQVWVVVDAGRKHEDTRLWVQNLASMVHVHAVAAFGLATTLTPESVRIWESRWDGQTGFCSAASTESQAARSVGGRSWRGESRRRGSLRTPSGIAHAQLLRAGSTDTTAETGRSATVR